MRGPMVGISRMMNSQKRSGRRRIQSISAMMKKMLPNPKNRLNGGSAFAQYNTRMRDDRLVPKMPLPQLVAVDIDGTLLSSQFNVSHRNLEALQEAHRRGVVVALATGRRHVFATPIAQLFGFSPYIISS